MVVHGVVQGVGYRWACVREAGRLGVSGWVRNLSSGGVEVVVEGPPDAVDAMVGWARHGPSGAQVTRWEATDEAPEGERGFMVRS